MRCCYSNTSATSYTQADGSKLSLLQRVLGSPILSAAVGVCATLLPIAWFVIVPFYIDTDALHHKYDFVPMAVNSFVAWRAALLGLIPLLTPVAFISSLVAKTGGFCGLTLASLIYGILLIIGNALSSSRTHSRQANENNFAKLFNEYYCDMRTLRVCLEGTSQQDLVILTRGSNATAGVFSAETPTSATLAIWKRCKTVILEAMAREVARDNDPEEASELEIETVPIFRFIDDTNGSRATDTWCGDGLYRTTPLSVADHLSLPSPYAANPAMFPSYTQEWSRRMHYSNIFLGTAIAGMVLVAFLHFVRVRNERAAGYR